MALGLSVFSEELNTVIGGYADFSCRITPGGLLRNLVVLLDFTKGTGNLTLGLQTRVGAPIKGTCNAGTSKTALEVTGETFSTKRVVAGDIITNVDTGEEGLVVTVTDEDSIVTSTMATNWDAVEYKIESGWINVADSDLVAYAFPLTATGTLCAIIPYVSCLVESRLKGSVAANDGVLRLGTKKDRS